VKIDSFRTKGGGKGMMIPKIEITYIMSFPSRTNQEGREKVEFIDLLCFILSFFGFI